MGAHLSTSDQIKFSSVLKLTIRRWFVLLLLAVAALAQTARKVAPKASSVGHKLVAIHVTGTRRYTPEEVIAASGLEVGTVINEEDFQKAARRLGECGFFSNVSYSYAATPTGTKPRPHTSGYRQTGSRTLQELVWFSQEELSAKIHERLPLFKGQAPMGGTLSDQISDVLQALLNERRVAARAEYTRDTKEPDGPIDAINFRATGVTLVIQEVHFSGLALTNSPP